MSAPGDLYGAIAAGPTTARIGGLQALDTDVITAHGAVVAAVDDTGHRHLLVPVPAETSGHADIGAAVTIRVRTLTDSGVDRRFVDVTCTEPRLNDLFDEVVSEMLDLIERTPGGEHRRTCQRVLDRWRQLLRRQPGRLLGREELAGLAGELWWVRRLARLDPDPVLRLWTGPTGADQDLTGAGLAVEVKAVTGVPEVEIHGIGQLQAPAGSELLLAVVHLGPPEDTGGTTVPDLIDELGDLGVDTVALLAALARVNYDHADRETYEAFAWSVTNETIHRVSGDFPRITPDTAPRANHPALSTVRYQLDLTRCPAPEDLEPDDVAARLVGAP